GWYANSVLLRRTSVPGLQLRLQNLLVPLLRAESALSLPFGLSLIAVGRKPGVAGGGGRGRRLPDALARRRCLRRGGGVRGAPPPRRPARGLAPVGAGGLRGGSGRPGLLAGPPRRRSEPLPPLGDPQRRRRRPVHAPRHPAGLGRPRVDEA